MGENEGAHFDDMFDKVDGNVAQSGAFHRKYQEQLKMRNLAF